MRKFLKIGLVALSLVALPMTSFAQWMRPNNFTQAKGATRIAEIKRMAQYMRGDIANLVNT